MFSYDKVKDSYKWELKNTKNTFPVDFWVQVLIGILYHNKKRTDIEKEFTEQMNTIKRPTNNMYVNSLLQKFLISPKQDIAKIRNKFTEGELEEWVVDHINQIIDKHFLAASERAKIWMKNWREFYKYNYEKTPNYNNDVAEKILNKYREKMFNENKKFDWEEINMNSYTNSKIEKIKLLNFEEHDFNAQEKNDNNAKIGKLGERIFRDALVSKYGYENVKHKSEVNEYADHDFEVTINKEVHFFEVKSTTRIAFSKFFISRNELNFWKSTRENNQKYSLILIRGINFLDLKKGTILPSIKEIKNPLFEINLDGFGFSDGKILVTPIKFIGQI